MARTQAATFGAQREQIRNAAAQCFAQKTFVRATLGDVAKHCGVSRTLVYHYYRDKRSLLADIADDHNRRLWAICENARKRKLPPRDELRELVLGMMTEYQTSRATHVVLFQDRKHLPPDSELLLVSLQRKILERGMHILAAAYGTRASRERLLPLAMALFGILNWTVSWLREDGALSYPAFGAMALDLFDGGAGAVLLPRKVGK